MRRAGGGAIRDILIRRREEIVSALRAGAKAKEDAAGAYEEARLQLADLPRDAMRLREEMRGAAEAERSRRLKVATEVAARISRDARQVADQEVRAARLALRGETVRAAFEQTLALLRRQIKSGDQERFLGEFAAARRIDASARLDAGAVFRVGNTRLRLEEGEAARTPSRARAEARLK